MSAPDRETTTFFVYGTLRPGGRYFSAIAPLVYESVDAHILGYDLWHLPEGYPAIIAGRSRVRGDLLRFSPDTLEDAMGILDEIEDCRPGDDDALYERIITEAWLSKTSAVRAYTYVYHAHRHPYLHRVGRPVAGGDWRAFMRSPTAQGAS